MKNEIRKGIKQTKRSNQYKMSLAIYSQTRFTDFGCYSMPIYKHKNNESSILYRCIITNIYNRIKMTTGLRILRKFCSKKNNKHKISQSLVDRMEKVRKKPLNVETEMPISKQYTTANGKYSTCIWQLDKHQDFVRAIGNNMIVADGHGTDIVSDWLKSLSDNVWTNVFKQPNPLSYLNNMLLTQSFSTIGSGACVTIIKTHSTYVEVFYSGDAKAQVYINRKKVKETDKHDASNPKEKMRVLSQGAYTIKEKMMEVLKPSDDKVRLTQVIGERIRFDKDAFLQMTQCIGHSRQGTPGISNTSETGYFRVDFDKTDDVKVIAGSDGVWDIMHESINLSHYKNAENIVLRSCLNWYNDFEFVHPSGHKCAKCKEKTDTNDLVVSIQKGLASDDISACMWHRTSTTQ